jgi:hypothetical protein
MKTISPELQSAMKKLSLGKILDALGERIVLAEKDSMPILPRLVDSLVRLPRCRTLDSSSLQ